LIHPVIESGERARAVDAIGMAGQGDLEGGKVVSLAQERKLFGMRAQSLVGKVDNRGADADQKPDDGEDRKFLAGGFGEGDRSND